MKDRALQDKFLYALLTTIGDWTTEFELDEPDISEGIKDSGMWKVLDLEGTGEEGTANITGVLDKVMESGITSWLPGIMMNTSIAQSMGIHSGMILNRRNTHIDAPGPETYMKDDTVTLRIIVDNSSGTNYIDEELSIN